MHLANTYKIQEVYMGKNYYLGLDMGTSSVGWAVTDEKYRILRAKGKDLCGSAFI